MLRLNRAEGASKSYHLVRTKRKTVALIVRSDGTVEVRAPLRMKKARIDQFVASKQGWIVKQLHKVEHARQLAAQKRYVTGGLVRYLGTTYSLYVAESVSNQIHIMGEKLIVETARSADDEEYTEQLVNDWLSNQAREVFTQQYESACQHMGMTEDHMPRLRIRTMKTRWGSYSSKTHRVCLNVRLIEAPVEAIRMVCIHELCHIQNLSHDKAFYELMHRYQDPGWRAVKKSLNTEWR